jgi:Lon protease-like protein
MHNGDLAQTGCSAMILKTLREYEDGRTDILTSGRQAFRLLRTYEDMPYLEADVEYLTDDFSAIDPAVSAELQILFNRCHRLLYEEDAPSFESESSASLAYHAGSELPIDTAFRQILLELRSEADRQRTLLDRLTQWYPELQNRDRVRGKASGNGHGKL